MMQPITLFLIGLVIGAGIVYALQLFGAPVTASPQMAGVGAGCLLAFRNLSK